jgi:formylglycine-generating enzyme required for sulfatase activity
MIKLIQYLRNFLYCGIVFGLNLICGVNSMAQSVTNVKTIQRGSELLISYKLSTDSVCDVSLFVSTDDGKSWAGPLQHVSGDVGSNISEGNKTICWHVLNELEQLVGNNIQFKVVADRKRWFEPEMVFVKGGKFLMGSDYANERPVHEVTLSDFYIGKYEFTQAQWLGVMGYLPKFADSCYNCPIVLASCYEVQNFIFHLNQQTGKNYRLPTEAEWEYAARGGDQSKNYVYSGSNDIDSVAWYRNNDIHKSLLIVAKQPNELGLYDMSGNASEWCDDRYSQYEPHSQTNPSDPPGIGHRVTRGGSIWSTPDQCRTTARREQPAEIGQSGFRLVLLPTN